MTPGKFTRLLTQLGSPGLYSVRVIPLLQQFAKALAIAHLEGPAAGIRIIEQLVGSELLRGYHLVDAALGELHRRSGHLLEARRYFTQAMKLTQSEPDRELLQRRLAACDGARP